MSSPLELAERALEAAPPGEALAHVASERSILLRFARSRPTQATAVDDVTVTIAAVRDGRVGTATTNSTDRDALRECGAAAAAAAEAAARSGAAGGYPGFPTVDRGRPNHGHDPETALADAAPGGAALAAAFEACGARGVEAHGTWTAAEVATAVASTAGGAAVEALTDAFMKVVAIAPSGRSGYAETTAVSAAEIDGGAIAERAAAKATAAGEPVRLPPGEYPVVLEPDAVGDLLGWLGAMALNGLEFAEERSALSGSALATTLSATAPSATTAASLRSFHIAKKTQ